MKYLKSFAVVLIFASIIFRRVPAFTQIGKDISDYKRATNDFLLGKNPYEWTIESYENDAEDKDMGDHGYAYLPGILYLYSYLYIIAEWVSVPFYVLWKFPVLIADLGVGILLVKKFWKESDLFTVVAPAFWFFNPYCATRETYTFMDPIAIFFMLLAIMFLKKDDVLSGAFYSLSIIFKTFPVILLPIFLILSKDKIKFILSCGIMGIVFSLPFMRSVSDFITYLHGSLFVHNERSIQGRPFLFYISYYYRIELFQIIPLKLYSIFSIFGGWVLSTVLYYGFKVKDKYILSFVSFLCFFTFTPVLNRTYLIWFLPLLLIASYNVSKKMFSSVLIQRLFALLSLGVFYVFYYWYLVQWIDGFHITRPY